MKRKSCGSGCIRRSGLAQHSGVLPAHSIFQLHRGCKHFLTRFWSQIGRYAFRNSWQNEIFGFLPCSAVRFAVGIH